MGHNKSSYYVLLTCQFGCSNHSFHINHLLESTPVEALPFDPLLCVTKYWLLLVLALVYCCFSMNLLSEVPRFVFILVYVYAVQSFFLKNQKIFS